MENKIIEIAKNVFIEKGYAETSMSELPSIRHIVNVGIPADVIRNRPDVRQA